MASLAAIGNDLYWGKRSFPFVGKRKVWYTVALCAVAISLQAYCWWPRWA